MSQKIEIKSAKKCVVADTHNRTMKLTYIKDADGRFVCPNGCKFRTPNQSTMHYHMKKHLKEMSYTCKKCSKGFLQKQALDLHMQSKHPEKQAAITQKFVCPYDDCEFTAITKGNTIIHCLRAHFHDEVTHIMEHDEDARTFVCSECLTEFSSTSAFYYHAKKCIYLDNNNDKHQKLLELIET